jgi:putative hydrolase of the HAD superfamily
VYREKQRTCPRLREDEAGNVTIDHVKHLLLDLDDTLLDYSGGVEECWSAACTEGCAGGALDPAMLLTAIADSRRSFWDDPATHRRERVNMVGAWTKIVERALAGLGRPDPALAATIARAFAARRRERMRLFPESLTCLRTWREAGIRLGMVTNGDASQQRDKIARHALADYFDVIVIEGEFGAGKPDEVVYRHALETLRARPEETWMVGDHLDFDVAGAQRLGMRGIWIDRPSAGLPANCLVRPDRIIRSLDELELGRRELSPPPARQ